MRSLGLGRRRAGAEPTGTSAPHSPRGYRPALDGIRALAVLSVMLYHADVAWARGGFLGVDVFFVLSGYLITSLLVNEWRRWGSIDLVRFYIRRTRRLLPALLLVVTAVAVWAHLDSAKDRLSTIRADGIASLLYVANWRFILVKASYFDQFGDPSPFRHTWSLAIEEQYYLLYPLLLAGLLALARRRTWIVPVSLTALAALSVLAMAMTYDAADPSRSYYGTDTRIHELMIGSVLGYVITHRRQTSRALRSRPSWGVQAGSVLALGGVLTSFAVLTDRAPSMYKGGFAAVCLVAAALIGAIELAPTGVVARVLSWRPVAWVGKISYGLYLWHWPIFIALGPDHTGWEGGRLFAARFALTFAAATASYYLVERPIRAGVLTRWPSWGSGLVRTAAVPAVLVALVLGTSGGVAQQLPDSPFNNIAPAGANQNSLLVVGDSVGYSLVKSFPHDVFPQWSVSDSTRLGCGLAVQWIAIDGVRGIKNPDCDGQLERWSAAVAAAKPSAVVLSLGPWEVFDHYLRSRLVKVSSPAYRRYLLARLEEAHQALTADGAALFIPNVPCYAQDSFELQGQDMAPIRNDPDRAAVVNEVLAEFAARHDDTTIVDDSSWLCPGGTYTESQQGVTIRIDGVHFGAPGGRLMWQQLLMPAIQKAAAPEDPRTRVLMVGDSVPLGLFKKFPKDDYPDLLVVDTTSLGCSSFAVPSTVDGQQQEFSPDCVKWEDSIPQTVSQFQPDVGVVFIGIGEQFDKLVDGDVIAFGTPEHEAWLTEQLTERIDLFHSRGVPVLLPTNTCHKVVDDTVGVADIVNDDARIRANNDLLRTVAAKYADGVTVVDLYSELCADGYTNSIDGVTLREDGLHFTDEGSGYVWSLLAPAVAAALDESAPTASPSGPGSPSAARGPSSPPTEVPESSSATSSGSPSVG